MTNQNDQETENISSLMRNEDTLTLSTSSNIPYETTNRCEGNHLDEFLDKVGYSNTHKVMIFIVSFILFVDGCEMILVNLFLSTLQSEWNLSNWEKSLLSSGIFIGFFTGSLSSGYFSNKLGRKFPTIIGSMVMYLFAYCVPLTSSFIQLFVSRIMVGLGIGTVVPTSITLVAEIIPTYFRSFVLNILWVLFPLGIVYTCLISISYINKNEVEWRSVSKINSYSSLLMLCLTLFLKESPRILILRGRYEEAFDILNNFSHQYKLGHEDKQKIISQAIQMNKKFTKNDFDIRELINEKYLKISILLAFIWFVSSLVSYCLLYIIPRLNDSYYAEDKRESIKHTIQAMALLFPCSIIRGAISEIRILGRIYTMMFGFLGTVICGILCIYDPSGMSTFSGLMKFFVGISIGLVSIYTVEVYPTNIRSIALGLGHSITRIGGILAPFICELALSLFDDAPFYFFILASISGIIAIMLLPYDTCGVALDSNLNEINYEAVELKDKI